MAEIMAQADQTVPRYCPEKLRLCGLIGVQDTEIALCDRGCAVPGGVVGGERRWWNPARIVLGDEIMVCGHDVVVEPELPEDS